MILTWCHVEKNLYDGSGRLDKSYNAQEKLTEFRYDALGRSTKTIRPSLAEEDYGYNALGYRVAFTNADGNAVHFGMDAQGRVMSITNALEKVTSFDYDDAGNLVYRRDAENRVTDFGFDELNRLVAITNEGVWKASFGYDFNNNLTDIDDADAQIDVNHDAMNRIDDVTINLSALIGNMTVDYGYDQNGNRTAIDYPGNLQVEYDYDDGNRLDTVTVKLQGSADRVFDFGYDTANRLTSLIYPNGVQGHFTPNELGQLTAFRYEKGGTNFIHRSTLRNELGYKTQEDVFAGLVPVPPTAEVERQATDTADRIEGLLVKETHTSTNELSYVYQHSENGCLTNILLSGTTWPPMDMTTTTALFRLEGRRPLRPNTSTTLRELGLVV